MTKFQIFLEHGKVKVQVQTSDYPKIVLDNYDEAFNDGRWHTVVLTISKDLLILSIDYRPMRTIRKLQMSTGGEYFIAGKFLISKIHVEIPIYTSKFREGE